MSPLWLMRNFVFHSLWLHHLYMGKTLLLFLSRSGIAYFFTCGLLMESFEQAQWFINDFIKKIILTTLIPRMNYYTCCLPYLYACGYAHSSYRYLAPGSAAHYYFSLMLPHPLWVSSFQTYYCCSSQNIFLESSPSQEERKMGDHRKQLQPYPKQCSMKFCYSTVSLVNISKCDILFPVIDSIKYLWLNISCYTLF